MGLEMIRGVRTWSTPSATISGFIVPRLAMASRRTARDRRWRTRRGIGRCRPRAKSDDPAETRRDEAAETRGRETARGMMDTASLMLRGDGARASLALRGSDASRRGGVFWPAGLAGQLVDPSFNTRALIVDSGAHRSRGPFKRSRAARGGFAKLRGRGPVSTDGAPFSRSRVLRRRAFCDAQAPRTNSKSASASLPRPTRSEGLACRSIVASPRERTADSPEV